ncbi:MAG: (2Fe-2S)-binding protein [Myxococcota bacterium]
MIVCLCHSVSDREVREHVQGGCRTVGQISRACGAGTDCGQCVDVLRRMVREGAPSTAGGEPGVAIAQQARVL